MASSSKTLYTLQIFRGLAALLVLLAHSQMYVNAESFLKIFEPGTSGVTFFFVLSGFIICYSNYNSIGNGVDHVKFFMKRVKRIYPIYWVYTVFVLAVSYYLYRKTGTALIEYSSFQADDYFKSFLLFPYSKVGDQWPFIPVAWTLSYEMLFYFAFFFVIYLRPRYSLVIIWAWFCLIVASLFGLIATKDNLALAFFFNAEIIEFYFGCFIAIMLKRRPNIPGGKTTARAMVLTGIILLLVSWGSTYFDSFNIKNYHRLLTFGVPYALLIWGAALLELNSANDFLKTKFGGFLIYVGDASYSMYLVHYWVLAMLFRNCNTLIPNQYVLFIIISLTTVFISLSAYQYIELPLLNMLRQRSRGTLRSTTF